MQSKISKSVAFFSVFIFGVASVFLHKIFVFCCLLGVSVIALKFCNKISRRFGLILMLVFCFAAVYTVFKVPHGDKLQSFVQQDHGLVGIVSSVPKEQNGKVKFYLDVKEVDKSRLLNDAIYGTSAVSLYKNTAKDIKIGKEIYLYGVLNEPRSASNLGQFDYRNYLKNQGIFTVFYADDYKVLDPGTDIFLRIQGYFSELASGIIQKHAPFLSDSQLDLLGGIVFGHRSVNLADDVRDDFINSGTFHVLAASGMQVGLILFFWCLLMKLLKVPVNLSLLSGGVMVIIYSCFTGLPPSILRAMLMAEFIILGKLIDREADNIALLLLVCSLMLLYNPLFILDVGFQLSFITTFGLLFCLPKFIEKFPKIPSFISGTILITVVAQAFATPLLIYYFNNLPFYSLFANFFMIPVVSMVTYIGFLSSLFSLIPHTGVVLHLFSLLMKPFLFGLNFIAHFFAKIPFSLLYIKQVEILSVVLMYIFIIFTVLFLQNGFKNKISPALSFVSLVILLAINVNYTPHKGLEMVFFDVGNSDAILLTLPNKKTVLIDTGRYNPYGSSSGKTVICEYLKHKGYSKIDALILTHPDADHIGGCVDVLKFAKVGTVYQNTLKSDTDVYCRLCDYLKNKHVNTEYISSCTEKQLLLDDQVKIRVMAPDTQNKNDGSLITCLESEGFSAVFMGDAEKDSMRFISNKIHTPVNLLKLGHHGSKDSIDEGLIRVLEPQKVVICVGKNKYKHPDFGVLELLDKHKIPVYRTDVDKMLYFDYEDRNIVVKRYSSELRAIQ